MTIEQTPINELREYDPEAAARIAANRERMQGFFTSDAPTVSGGEFGQPTAEYLETGADAIGMPDMQDPEYLAAFRNAETQPIPVVTDEALKEYEPEDHVARWLQGDSVGNPEATERLDRRLSRIRAIGSVALFSAGASLSMYAVAAEGPNGKAAAASVALTATSIGMAFIDRVRNRIRNN